MAQDPDRFKVSEGTSYGGNLQNPNKTTSISPGFDSWTTPDTSRPVWIEIEFYIETDGTTDGIVEIDVDESGGTATDYSFTFRTDAALGGAGFEHTYQFYLPIGASFQARNSQDPNVVNSINVARKVTA